MRTSETRKSTFTPTSTISGGSMPSIRDPRLSPTIKLYLTFLVARNLSPNTVRAYRSDLAELAEFAGARARVAGMDHADVRQFLLRLQHDGIGRNTVYRKR